MRMVGIRDFRANLTRYVSCEEPVLVTRRGKVMGFYLRLEDVSRVPEGLRRELASAVGSHLSRLLEARAVNETELEKDFRARSRARL